MSSAVAGKKKTRRGGNRSYVIRAGRMSGLQKRALDELLPVYGIPFREEPLDLHSIFGNRAPVIVEIGFGMGAATLELAEEFENYDFIGIEVHPPGVGKVLDEIERRGLENLKIIYHDAVSAMEQMFSDNVLEGLHIFFPDPWPKKKHHKRRIIQQEFAETLAEKLRPGGYLYTVTDWEDYAWHIVRTLSGVDTLKNMHEVFAPSVPWRPRTSFERKGISSNHLIREILYRKEE
jgi:tRNA (guanine-N7-)-methyltransferase